MTTAIAETHRRKTKMARMRAEGIDPFPHLVRRERDLVADVLAAHRSQALSAGAHQEYRYRLAGRLMVRRRRGEIVLLDLRDRSGTMRICVRGGVRVKSDAIARMLEWDIGDIVAIGGHLYVSDRGEVGLEARSGTLLAKAMRLPPIDERGLKLAGNRPELELLASEGCRRRLQARAIAVAAVRDWFTRHGFFEVETPILQPVAGGAVARPFVSHHNALSRETSLRISGELYLRRCTVGGLERVFDIGKRFRNEGISRRHNPEFTMLEWFMAFSDYRDAAAFTEGLIVHVAQQVLGCLTATFKGATIDLTLPWRRVTLRELMGELTGVDILASDRDELLELLPAGSHGQGTWAEAVEKVFGARVEPNLIQPTVVTHFPVQGRPFIKRDSRLPEVCESFEMVMGGMEIVSGGTGVDDPEDQASRFAERGDAAHDEDELLPENDLDYVTALHYGAPPAAGSGVGIDRLLMVLLDRDSIRDVIPFASPT